jgi:hypothetical protein
MSSFSYIEARISDTEGKLYDITVDRLADAAVVTHIAEMSHTASPDAVWSTLTAWPRGYFTARYEGRRYGVSNTAHANGRSMKLFAEELGGPDRISLNIYRPVRGDPALKPCEMPVDKVTAFVLGAIPEPVPKA